MNYKSRLADMINADLEEDTEEHTTSVCYAVWAAVVDGVVVRNSTLDPNQIQLPGTSLSGKEVSIMKGMRRLLWTVAFSSHPRYPLYEQDDSEEVQP